VFVFVHGGGLRSLSSGEAAYIGEALLHHGAVFVAAGYRLMPEVEYPDMVEDLALGLRWVFENIERRGGSPDQIVLGGHSAGATLAALLGLRTGWLRENHLPESLVKGLVLISGSSVDRRPDTEVNHASPYYVPDIGEAIERAPDHTIVVTAEDDLDGCQPDAEALVLALARHAASYEFLDALSGTDHFFIGHELADPDGRVLAATTRMMGLA
jgi:acetyl esterase/lipase